jgi:hypothetical protein
VYFVQSPIAHKKAIRKSKQRVLFSAKRSQAFITSIVEGGYNFTEYFCSKEARDRNVAMHHVEIMRKECLWLGFGVAIKAWTSGRE